MIIPADPMGPSAAFPAVFVAASVAAFATSPDTLSLIASAAASMAFGAPDNPANGLKSLNNIPAIKS